MFILQQSAIRITVFSILLTLLHSFTLAQKAKSAKVPSHQEQQKWLLAFNNDADLHHFYSDQSGVLLNDVLITGVDKINQEIKVLKGQMSGKVHYERLDEFQIHDNSKFEYGIYKDALGKSFFSVIGWRNNNAWVKEFEAVYPMKEIKTSGIGTVDQGRQTWEKYSNNHQPTELAKKLCMKKGYYFNRGRVFQGMEIAEAYAYMAKDTWQIKLEGKKSLQVNQDIIYDVGSYQSSGKGMYVLIWKRKGKDWKILLDYNF